MPGAIYTAFKDPVRTAE